MRANSHSLRLLCPSQSLSPAIAGGQTRDAHRQRQKGLVRAFTLFSPHHGTNAAVLLLPLPVVCSARDRNEPLPKTAVRRKPQETAGMGERPPKDQQRGDAASFSLPIHPPPTSRRNKESRNYFTNYSPAGTVGVGAEAINGPVRELARGPAPAADRLIVGVDFGTTFSGWAQPFFLSC